MGAGRWGRGRVWAGQVSVAQVRGVPGGQGEASGGSAGGGGDPES